MGDKLSLSKQIPARTKTLTARWCRQDWMEIDDTFRAIRERSRNPMTSCFWCKHKFENGEMMALAAFDGKAGNRTLCQDCAAELLRGEEV